jgi:hypothetical protein
MQLSLVMLAKGSCPVVCCTDCGQEGRLACATSCTDVLVRSSRRVNERQSWYVTQRRMLTHSSTLGQMRVTVLRLRVPHSTSTLPAVERAALRLRTSSRWFDQQTGQGWQRHLHSRARLVHITSDLCTVSISCHCCTMQPAQQLE